MDREFIKDFCINKNYHGRIPRPVKEIELKIICIPYWFPKIYSCQLPDLNQK